MYIQSKGFNDDGDGGGYMTKVNGDDDDDINEKETKILRWRYISHILDLVESKTKLRAKLILT